MCDHLVRENNQTTIEILKFITFYDKIDIKIKQNSMLFVRFY